MHNELAFALVDESNDEQRLANISEFLNRFLYHLLASLIFLLLMTLQVSMIRMWRFQFPFAVFVVLHSTLFVHKARLYKRRRAIISRSTLRRSREDEDELDHRMAVLLREVFCEVLLLLFYVIIMVHCARILPVHSMVALIPLVFSMLVRLFYSKWPVMPCEVSTRQKASLRL